MSDPIANTEYTHILLTDDLSKLRSFVDALVVLLGHIPTDDTLALTAYQWAALIEPVSEWPFATRAACVVKRCRCLIRHPKLSHPTMLPACGFAVEWVKTVRNIARRYLIIRRWVQAPLGCNGPSAGAQGVR